MKKIYLLFFIIFTQTLFSQNKDSLFLRIAIPETDTLKIFANKQRIAASTLPTARAFINQKEIKVYPSGAFVALVSAPTETTLTNILVRFANGDSLTKNLVFLKDKPLTTSPKEPIIIENSLMLPSQDLWLNKGEILEVRFKGSPDYEAFFDIEGVAKKIPMKELSAKEAGGLEGVYVGKYVVEENDEADSVSIRFWIKRGFWSSDVEKYSTAKISIVPKKLPYVGEVIGTLPYLNAGLGEDRLGGARLGYIEKGVKLIITGKIGNQYKIQLHNSLEAWIPEEFVRILPPETPLPSSLVGAISAMGNKKEDYVVVSLSEKLPYTTETFTSPASIIVNIYGATSNTNWIQHQRTATNIENVQWNQIATNHYQLKILLKDSQHWGYDIEYEKTSLKIKIRRPPKIHDEKNILSGLTFALDAGHGGENNRGALGATGAVEKDITLPIIFQLQNLLKKKGAETILTRSSDVGVGNTSRINKILSSNADMLISVHCNSAGNASDPEKIQGTSTYYRHVEFKILAETMYDKMTSLGLAPFGVTGSFNFALNSLTQLPNVLVETAFISNPEDEMKLIDEGFQKKIAEKIVEGLEEFFIKAKGKKMNYEK